MRRPLWGLTLLRGILSVILGIALFAWPAEGAEVFIMLFGLFALITGVLAVIDAISARYRVWGLSLGGGILTIIFGLLAFFWPGVIADVLVWMVAIWAIVFGVLEIIAGASIPATEALRALAIGIGLLTLALGLLLLVDPTVGIVAASILLGFYFVTGGALSIYRATVMRRVGVVTIG